MRRLLIGFLATIGVIAIVCVAVIGTVTWLLWPEEARLPDDLVLSLDLREGFVEAVPADPLVVVGLVRPMTLIDAVLALDQAADDPRVKGVVARFDGDGAGFAQAQELRAAIARLRAAGKFTLAHADSFGEFGPGTRDYYLASAFEAVHLQPLGALGLTGLLIETPLLRGLFDELGITPSGGKRGAYKTAANMFTERELTPEHRESLESIAGSISEQLRAGLVESRGLAPEEVGRLIDGGPYGAAEALELGLVDALSYWDEVEAAALAQAGGGSALVDIQDYADGLAAPADAAPVIALVRGVGQIARGDSSAGPSGWVMGGDTVATALAEAIDDPEVEAILFRIDSGGGSAVASETIGRQVRRAIAAGKPVIVSMGEVAASGGYWVAMDAATIVAGPATLTGSIGVLAGKPVLDELWSRIGVAWGQAQRGANADLWSLNSDYDSAGRARLEAFLDQVYDGFLGGVARGRDLALNDVRAVAEGRVWTGAQARQLGLVDELGGFATALTLAKDAAGAAPGDAVELRPFPPPRSRFEDLLTLLDHPLLGLRTIAAWLALRPDGILSAPAITIR